MPLTFYKDIKQIPAFSDYDMTGKPYRYFNGDPLYEFGYGLSYSTFEYAIKNAPETIKSGENITISVDVENTGKMDGAEVAQLYVSLPDSKLKTPIRALQGFKRIHLKAGETKTVEFTVTPKQMAGRDKENLAQVSNGKVLLSVGGKQPDSKAINSKQVVQKEVQVTGNTFYIKD